MNLYIQVIHQKGISVEYSYFKSAQIGGHFLGDVRLTIKAGMITAIDQGIALPAGEIRFGHAMAGMANLHSHAFQRAMVGLTEFKAVGESSFWSWRTAMYHLAGRMTPEALSAIASQLYIEMLKAGYTSVGEFHYLHNSHKDQELAMTQAILRAGDTSGLPITMLPVLYQSSDFGGKDPNEGQKPFIHELSDFERLLTGIHPHLGPNDSLGMALHSLRAVDGSVVAEAAALMQDGPIHIHIAEQVKEVEASIAHSGKRPVEWLLDAGLVDDRWCLIHATHMNNAEMQGLASSGAVAGICPTTEGNLGDGFFRSKDYISAGGIIGIGSDSHISVDPREELRLLEYGERLSRGQRTVLAGAGEHTGLNLWTRAARGGAQALNQPAGEIAVGKRADIIVLDLDAPQFIGPSHGQITDSFIFAGQPNPVSDVMIAGNWVIKDGNHAAQGEVLADYKQHVNKLLEGFE